MKLQYLIYGLVDPRTLLRRYVGQSSRGLIRSIENHSDYCKNWIRSLKLQGLRPLIEILDECPDDEIDPFSWMNRKEIEWINWSKEDGLPLTNLTSGGGGRRASFSQFQKLRMGMSQRGKVLTDEWKKKISQGVRNSKKRVVSSEGRLRLSLAHRGMPSPRRGKTHSIESREKMRHAKLGRKFSDETRKKMSQSHMGVVSSDEKKRKISEAQKLRWSQRHMFEVRYQFARPADEVLAYEMQKEHAKRLQNIVLNSGKFDSLSKEQKEDLSNPSFITEGNTCTVSFKTNLCNRLRRLEIIND